MALSDDEKRLLEELTAKANEPDADDFEIEVYDTQAGKGARIPFSQGKSWLFSTFGIGEAPASAPSGDGGENGAAGAGAPPAGSTGHFFGRNQGSKKS